VLYVVISVSCRSICLMATESVVLGQLGTIPTAQPSFFTASSSEPRPPLQADPLQGLVQEMALSAVMQKHPSSLPPSSHSTHASNGTIVNSYVVPSQTNSSVSPSSVESSITTHTPHSAGLVQLGSSQQGHGPHSAGLVQLSGPSSQQGHGPHSAGLVQLSGSGSGAVQQGFITLSSAQAGGAGSNMSLLAHPQPSPVLQGSPMTLTGQLHEVGGNSPAASMVQFTPISCYEGNTQLSPAVERSSMVQSNFMG
jgi:hypothetical protein